MSDLTIKQERFAQRYVEHGNASEACNRCRSKKDAEKYHARPKKEAIDGHTLYSDAHDRYFFTFSELYDYLECLEEDDDIKMLCR